MLLLIQYNNEPCDLQQATGWNNNNHPFIFQQPFGCKTPFSGAFSCLQKARIYPIM